MKTIFKSILIASLGVSMAQCSDDYLDVSSPANTDDSFVTSTPDETYKTLSWCYGNYRQNVASGGNYNWEDAISDVEYYPENDSPNNVIGKLHPENVAIGGKQTQFNGLFETLARAKRIADILENKPQYISARDAGTTNDWTHLYGEAITMRALCYFQLCLHFGDVPYGIENTVADSYTLSSRYAIYDAILADLDRVQGLMYTIGQGGITAERISRTFACGLAGKIAMHAAGYQTLRTDVTGLYGDISFDKIGQESNKCFYARRSDYLNYIRTAEKFFDLALGAAKGATYLVTVDDRAGINNPYQRSYQYIYDMQTSPESLFEVACIEGQQGELGYSQGRPSDGGGSNAAPCKVFAGVRITPTAYYSLYEDGDLRADANMTVTGSDGKGNEAMLSFVAGSRLNGGISTNKWDVNRMNPPFVAKQRQMGMNYQVLRIADVMLLNAEAKAYLGKDGDAKALLDQIRACAFGDNNHSVSATGDALLEAIWHERALELLGEGEARWDMIRSGKFHERTSALKSAMAALKGDLRSKGWHDFGNGRVMPAYIWVKKVQLSNPLTFDAVPGDPARTPGWRGVYDYSTIEAVAGKVQGTNHNLAIQGLYRYIDPTSSEAAALEADGYAKTNWGADLISDKAINDDLFLGGWKNGEAPRYFHPIPYETLNQSKGNVTNGYGLPQE